jgi:uncharacterized hydrophobic protein (TIGR00271 family)
VRQLQVLVDDEQREAVADIFREEGVDYVRQEAWADGDQQWLFSAPVPSDAVGYFLNQLEAAGVDAGQYTLIGSLESAMTPGGATLQQRFASDFDPLTQPELLSKATDMSQDPTSFLSMIFLSTLIAAAGLLVGSPAVVVGSMVIAPIVGPVLTATVGAAVGDRKMLLDSLRLQALGLIVAVLGSTLFSGALVLGGFMPDMLDITSLDLISVRLSPGMLSVAIGLASGAAGAFGLTTKGPTSLIGVMIAAALIPAAATSGIALVWTEPLIAVGSLLLLVVTMVLINLGAFLVLLAMGYRPDESGWLFDTTSRRQQLVVGVTVVSLLLVVGTVGVATVQQIGFDRTVTDEVNALATEYPSLKTVTVRTEYEGRLPFSQPETVTIGFSYNGSGSPPDVVDDLETRIQQATGQQVTVRTVFTEYSQSGPPANTTAGNQSRPATNMTMGNQSRLSGQTRSDIPCEH